MDPFVTWGYPWIEGIQTLRSPTLDVLFAILSFLGDEPFYLILVPLVYWSLSRGAGLRLALLFLTSAWLNGALKGAVDLPRPSPDRVHVLEPRYSGGLPSGHAQTGLVVWGYLTWLILGLRSRERAGPVAAAFLLVLGIGISRLYRGAHFPMDILVGWLVGLSILVLAVWATEPLAAWFARRSTPALLALAAAAPVAMVVLYRQHDALPAAATLFGASLGAVWERRHLGFGAQGGPGHRALRILVGLAVALGIWMGLRGPLDDFGDPGRFFRYALLGGWLTAGAPLVFVWLGIAPREPGGRRAGAA